ncbi:MAG: hypothetical protein U1A06_03275 [Hoeflea sp.]|nr:hypothetical protein [Hoeflea sp.]
MTISPNDIEKRYLDELLESIRGPCDAQISVEPSIISDDFAREFRATLLIHHYFLKSPLGTNSFDAAFIRAARAAGLRVKPALDGQRFWDVEIEGRKISLKSTAASNLKPGTLHISKLCEAAWIQDMRRADQREMETKRLFKDYTSVVDSIIQLRMFKFKAFYELVEIPTILLAQVADVERAAFAPDGPTIGIPVGKNPPDFTLKLDRSDAKVTLANINKDVCRVLATWQLDPKFNIQPEAKHI